MYREVIIAVKVTIFVVTRDYNSLSAIILVYGSENIAKPSVI